MSARVLVAGVGNIFLSDDGFGVEVAKRLTGRALPKGVEVIDFGIRGVHLAYQLLEGYDLLVLVDVVSRGEPPGTLYLIEPEPGAVSDRREAVAEGSIPLIDAHGMEPGAVVAMLDQLGAQVGKVVVVGCEPADLSEGIGLSPAVAAAVPAAVELVMESLPVPVTVEGDIATKPSQERKERKEQR